MGTTDAEAGHAEAGHADEEHEHASRWPLITALGAAALYFGVGLAFVGFDLIPAVLSLPLIGLGVVGFLGGIAGWTYEAFLAHYSDGGGFDRGRSVYVGGMVLFLVSDLHTFLGGFVYYGFIRVGAWPPSELPNLLSSLVLVNTLLLIASSVTIHYAHESLDGGNRRRFLGLLGVTFLLGVVFLGGQALEYYEFVVEEGFTLTSGMFASAFYGLTGLHGLHVALGVVLIGLTLGRALLGQFGPDRDTAVRTVSLYWHFVDVVWILLVLVVYVGAALG